MPEEKDSYLEKIYEAWKDSSNAFQKNLTFISSGIFAVSYAFIDKIVDLKNACPCSKAHLVFGWECVCWAIFLSLLGHGGSVALNRMAVYYYDPEETVEQRRIRIGSLIFSSSINIAAIILILVGAYQILKFIKINF